MAHFLEAKICVLGAQGVGKTSLVNRYCHNKPPSSSTPSTIGANFVTKRTSDADTGTPLKLQIWDTAGQERFRSIAKLYYRGASAVLLVYSITSRSSFVELKSWMKEVREQLGHDVIVHIVGTMSDLVQSEPGARQVEMEEVIAYVAEHIAETTPVSRAQSAGMERNGGRRARVSASLSAITTPPTGASSYGTSHIKRQSGYGWEHELGWDVCHEISAESGEGIDEVFRVLTRKLVEQELKRQEKEAVMSAAITPYSEVAGAHTPGDYFGRPMTSTNGSFRLHDNGVKRKSWLGFPSTPSLGIGEQHVSIDQAEEQKKAGRCC